MAAFDFVFTIVQQYWQIFLGLLAASFCFIALLHAWACNKAFTKGLVKEFIHWLILATLFVTLHLLGDVAITTTSDPKLGFTAHNSLAYIFAYGTILLAAICFIRSIFTLKKMSKLYGFASAFDKCLQRESKPKRR